jgi:spore coat protein U-like protein
MSKLNSTVMARVVAAALLASAASAASAATVQGNVTVGATLTAGCQVQGGAISFGSFLALTSAGDKNADTGTSFKIACTSGVTPTISSATTREMTDGTGNLPFQLSLTAGAAADDFPTTPGAFTFTSDGTLQTVAIYAKVLNTNFTGANALPAGVYSKTVVVDVDY